MLIDPPLLTSYTPATTILPKTYSDLPSRDDGRIPSARNRYVPALPPLPLHPYPNSCQLTDGPAMAERPERRHPCILRHRMKPFQTLLSRTLAPTADPGPAQYIALANLLFYLPCLTHFSHYSSSVGVGVGETQRQHPKRVANEKLGHTSHPWDEIYCDPRLSLLLVLIDKKPSADKVVEFGQGNLSGRCEAWNSRSLDTQIR
jgi:hypothetical protein